MDASGVETQVALGAVIVPAHAVDFAGVAHKEANLGYDGDEGLGGRMMRREMRRAGDGKGTDELVRMESGDGGKLGELGALVGLARGVGALMVEIEGAGITVVGPAVARHATVVADESVALVGHAGHGLR